MNTSR
ncbi:hypothetical protein D018_2016A, partial [Vibrio parahaemolyticus VP2007-007]